jgi:hypothetical protein
MIRSAAARQGAATAEQAVPEWEVHRPAVVEQSADLLVRAERRQLAATRPVAVEAPADRQPGLAEFLEMAERVQWTAEFPGLEAKARHPVAAERPVAAAPAERAAQARRAA